MKCRICEKQTKESLRLRRQRNFLGFRWQGYERGVPYCREHLVEAFGRAVSNSSCPMIFFYPDLEDKSGSYQYFYVPLSEIERHKEVDESGRTVQIIGRLERVFDRISGKCEKCSSMADSAVFPKGSFSWGPGAQYLSAQFNQPVLEDIQEANALILCRKCALEEVSNGLLTWSGEFSDGIVGPLESRGFYWASEV